MGALLVVYSFYNVIWALKRHLAEKFFIDYDGECPEWTEIILYVAHYLLFAFAFFLVAAVVEEHPEREMLEFTLAVFGLFFAYKATYFFIWWSKWHKQAMKHHAKSLY